MRKGKIIIISAPSGTGKGTVISRMFELRDGIELSVSATTRAPREGEIDGVHYHFISREAFEQMIDKKEFLEYAEYAGNYYGTPLPPLLDKTARGIDVVLEIEVQGFRQVKSKVPDAVAVFLAPPSLEELERRLRNRGTETEESINRRLTAAVTELAQKDDFDYIVVNDMVDRAAREIIEIINNTQE